MLMTFISFLILEDAEKGLAEITKIISKFELQINPSKTKIIEVRELVDESWKFNVKKLKISQKKINQEKIFITILRIYCHLRKNLEMKV